MREFFFWYTVKGSGSESVTGARCKAIAVSVCLVEGGRAVAVSM